MKRLQENYFVINWNEWNVACHRNIMLKKRKWKMKEHFLVNI
jgi:hypothetical protein